MSAIAGLLRHDGGSVSREPLARMVSVTSHLGVDGTQTWHEGPAGFVRFALRTTPQSKAEIQPCADPRGDLVALFDGRMDNRDDVRRMLGEDDPGREAPDVVILLAAFRRFGAETPRHLVGDYALAVWDRKCGVLFAARSPVGMRPLLWTEGAGFFAFASEPATLLKGLELPKKLNIAALGEHLAARFVTETETMWQGVYRLPPGHALQWVDGNIRTWCWHRGPFEDQSHLSESDHIDRFQELFDQALVATNRSSGPVFAQLSGGMDSSAIVCRIDHLVRDGRIDNMVDCVSARFPGEICDEGEWIAEVERQCGIHSRMVEGAPFDESRAAHWCAQTLHFPLRPNTAGTIEAVCRHASARGSRVVLTGEGGDDWLAGSRAHWPDLVKRGRWKQLARETKWAANGWNHPLRAGRALLGSAFSPLISQRQKGKMLRPHLDFSEVIPPWISGDWAEQIDLQDRWSSAYSGPDLDSFSQQQRYRVYSLARRHINMDNVFSFVASQGIEMRHPFHDLRLTHFLMGASGDMLMRGDVRKYLLREATQGILPEKIRLRSSKANISAPIIDAVSQRLAQRPFEEMHCVANGWVDGKVLERIHATHVGWRHAGDISPPISNYAAVWNAVAADMWLEYAYGL